MRGWNLWVSRLPIYVLYLTCQIQKMTRGRIDWRTRVSTITGNCKCGRKVYISNSKEVLIHKRKYSHYIKINTYSCCHSWGLLVNFVDCGEEGRVKRMIMFSRGVRRKSSNNRSRRNFFIKIFLYLIYRAKVNTSNTLDNFLWISTHRLNHQVPSFLSFTHSLHLFLHTLSII